MAEVQSVLSPLPTRARSTGLDRLRGLAIALMVLDHVCYIAGTGEVLRLTAGRLAMPLFFLVAGVLVRSPRPRWALIAALGMVLPVLVPWIDSPNVLVLYVVGALLLALFRHRGWPAWLLVMPALLLMANGWNLNPGTSYDLCAAVALMAVGSSFPAIATWGDRLPAVLEVPGRHPLAVYVGHLLGLQLLVMVL